MDALLLDIHRELGITPDHVRATKLTLHKQPAFTDLRVVDLDFEGKPFVLRAEVADAWTRMRAAALAERVVLAPFSGFRSYLHQKRLIERALGQGRVIDEILTHIAIPGFSEHHSGRAIDIHVLDKPVLDESFEKTVEFAWLRANAAQFGFRLSYPRDNSQGIIFEPWHWFFA